MNTTIKKIKLAGVSNIIAIASGKGGVGKSTVSAGLALALSRKCYKVGLMDADVYGPSIPLLTETIGFKPLPIESDGKSPQITPAEKHRIKIQSIGYFIDEKKAAIWRGPMASNTLMQLIEETAWCKLDFLIIDFPPGTGDIQLSIMQQLDITGAIIVTTPQTIAVTDATKAIEMISNDAFSIPILGIVENMSWFTPILHPNEKYFIFGKDGGKQLASQLKVPLLAQIPVLIENGNTTTSDDFVDITHPDFIPYFDALASKLQ